MHPQKTSDHNSTSASDMQNMTAKIQFFCWPEEKSAWIRAAHPQRLGEWIRHQLNQATGRPPRPTDEERRRIVM